MRARAVRMGAVGMACPVGLTAATACAAIRAGISRVGETEYLGNDGKPVMASCLERLGWSLTRQERWMELLCVALEDLCRRHEAGLAVLRDVPIILVSPLGAEPRGTTTPGLAAALSDRLGVQLDPTRIRLHGGGASGSAGALATARHWLFGAAATHRRVVVAAADSLVTARVMAELDRTKRLLREDRADGIIPGEAAACVLLDSSSPSGSTAILGIGLANEPGRRDNDVPLRGHGIVGAARQALSEAGLEMHDLHFRLSDASGDSYAFKEQVLAISRILRKNMDDFPLWLPATSLGDVGCAGGLCGLVHAAQAWERGRAPGPLAISYASSSDGNRSAVVLGAPEAR